MSNKQITSNSKSSRIRLPFEKRSTDVGSWSYDHRFGLCITVIIFLVGGIIFMSTKIQVRSVQMTGFILNVTETPVIIAEPEQERVPIKELSRADFSDIQNAISNEQAKQMEQVDQSSSEFAQNIINESKEVAKGSKSNKERYERGLREEQAIIDSMRSGANKGEKVEIKVNGNVTVSFSFTNPIRKSVDYDVPAYMCEGGGRVTVNVTVNNSGEVTSAVVDKKRSTSDQCIISTALNAAKRFKFNLDKYAPERHQGTINYIFVPQ